jgi:arsenate reductase
VLINHLGKGRVRGFSAGSSPVGKANPFAIELLKEHGLPTKGLRSKSWDEFSHPDAPEIHIVLTVCSNAANETCPVWPGHPVTAHWGIDDPAAVNGSNAEIEAAFRAAYDTLEKRIIALLSLPLEDMDNETLKCALKTIASTIQ